MRILMVVSNDVVHDTRVVKEARALRTAGHEVTLLGWDRTGRRAAYEVWDGFPLHRVRTRGSLRVLPNDLLRNPLWWRLATGVGRSLQFDAIHAHDLDALPIGVRLKRRTGKPLVYDCHEVFGYMIERDVPRFVTNYAFRMEARLAPYADRVVTVNEFVQKYIEGLVAKPAVVIRNTQLLQVEEYRPPPGDGPFTVLYVGTLHKSRFILPAIEVVAEMPEIRLVIAGGKQLSPLVRGLCAQHPNTEYLGEVPSERVFPMTLESHAVLSMFDPSHRINQVGVPNKIYEAMAAGRPSIVTRGLPMADIVEREQCGLAVPYTKDGLKEAIHRLVEDPELTRRLGRNGLAAAKREYNWDQDRRRLVSLYAEVAGSHDRA